MGRNKISIERIADEGKRQVCFTKRRQGLFKKATELCGLCDAQIIIIAFSNKGRAYAFGHPCSDAIINRYLAGADSAPLDTQQSQHVAALFSRVAELERQIADTMCQKPLATHWWDRVDLNEVNSYEELQRLKEGFQDLREKVAARVEELSNLSDVGTFAVLDRLDQPQSTSPTSLPLVPVSQDDDVIFGQLSSLVDLSKFPSDLLFHHRS